MQIKKVFSEVNALLEANKDQLVSSLMPQLLALMSAKVGGSEVGSTHLKDDQGNVIAIYCYYHKCWELLADHTYGLKAGTTTGYNSMCKLGVNQWTTQQRLAKKAKEALLTKLQNGELAIEDLAHEQELIERQRTNIVMAENYPRSFGSLEELKASLANVEAEVVADSEVEVVAKPKRVKKVKTEV